MARETDALIVDAGSLGPPACPLLVPEVLALALALQLDLQHLALMTTVAILGVMATLSAINLVKFARVGRVNGAAGMVSRVIQAARVRGRRYRHAQHHGL